MELSIDRWNEIAWGAWGVLSFIALIAWLRWEYTSEDQVKLEDQEKIVPKEEDTEHLP